MIQWWTWKTAERCFSEGQPSPMSQTIDSADLGFSWPPQPLSVQRPAEEIPSYFATWIGRAA